MFSVRAPRGKAAASKARHPDELKQSVVELSKRVTAMEKMLASSEEGRVELLAMISVMQLQIKELKDKAPKP